MSKTSEFAMNNWFKSAAISEEQTIRSAVVATAGEISVITGCGLIEAVTKLQGQAAKHKDKEYLLDALCSYKNELIKASH